VTLPAFAAERRCARSTAPAPRLQLSIGIFCWHGAEQQTRLLSLLLSIDGTDRRTGRYIDPEPICNNSTHCFVIYC